MENQSSIVRTGALRKFIYIRAMSLVAKGFENDRDAVTGVRDSYCLSMFGKPYTELTNYQLQRVLDEMIRDANPNTKESEKRASKTQIARVRYLASWFSIEYCNMDTLSENWQDKIYSGEELRTLLRRLHDQHKLQCVTHFTLNQLYLRCANPICNKFMIEGDFKKRANKPDTFYYEALKPEEANYLIQRFEQVRKNKEMTTTKFASNGAEEYLQETNMSLN